MISIIRNEHKLSIILKKHDSGRWSPEDEMYGKTGSTSPCHTANT